MGWPREYVSNIRNVVCRIMIRSHALKKFALQIHFNNHFICACTEGNIAMLQAEPIEEIMVEASSTQATDACETEL